MAEYCGYLIHCTLKECWALLAYSRQFDHDGVEFLIGLPLKELLEKPRAFLWDPLEVLQDDFSLSVLNDGLDHEE